MEENKRALMSGLSMVATNIALAAHAVAATAPQQRGFEGFDVPSFVRDPRVSVTYGAPMNVPDTQHASKDRSKTKAARKQSARNRRKK